MGTRVHGVATGAMVLGVVLGTSGLGYAVSHLPPTAHHRAVVAAASQQEPTAPSPSVSATASAPAAAPRRTPAPRPVPRPHLPPKPGPRLLGPGDDGARVRELQSRLRQIAWYAGNVTDHYGPTTTASVKGFQAKRRIAVTGYVDRRTLDRLHAMTRTPTADELANRFPGDTSTSARLDPRCTTGRAICVDKHSSTLRWVVDGHVRKTMAVRFGAAYSPTREGLFHVGWKSRDHVSKLYGSSMPFAMFFSGGQAVHYSSDFAARGYAGASHGCVNVRDYDGVRWLFDQVRVGDKVVIYWS